MAEVDDLKGNAAGERVALPPGVEEVFGEFRTCEFTTLGRDGTPITWPLVALWQPGEGRFVLTTSIGLPQKAFNIRRDPRVSLLFSDPTASGLGNPPAVLVQGEAEAPDRIETSPNRLREYWRRLFEIQPAGKVYGANRLTRYLMDWYYMRLYISVRPRRILFWPSGDFSRAPLEAEVDRVA
ncbi:MAG TPA: pyridoxamine 5'-phosphate oxidase family protein [Rubrobacter sp.]|nr:pyridoxamine 5'-phosphate oxidase family protein [Rubrobacter sp.]